VFHIVPALARLANVNQKETRRGLRIHKMKKHELSVAEITFTDACAMPNSECHRGMERSGCAPKLARFHAE
jgi:hypothetical protein